MLSEGKVATPAIAANVLVPDNLPPAGFVPIETVTLPAKPVAVLPSASRAVTPTSVAIPAHALAVLGCTVKTSWVASPGVIVNGALVAPSGPVALAVSVYPLPLLSRLRLENVATPPTTATVVEPDRVPPAGFVPIATVTLSANPGTAFPHASRALTWTGVSVFPADAPRGCAVKTSCAGRPALMAKGELVVPASPPAVADSGS